tara:strand:- start:764 stop:1036 length:273 start_codon:yes stop_codon:yes gene_type:complete
MSKLNAIFEIKSNKIKITLLQQIILLMGTGTSLVWTLKEICLLLNCDESEAQKDLDYLMKLELVVKDQLGYHSTTYLKERAIALWHKHKG